MGRQEGLDKLPCERGANHFSAETTNIHVVIFDSLVGAVDVIDECSANAGDLVGDNRRTHAAVTEGHSPFNLAGRDCPCQRDDDIGVVIARNELVRTKIDDLETGVVQ
jgi:hypothetical protein